MEVGGQDLDAVVCYTMHTLGLYVDVLYIGEICESTETTAVARRGPKRVTTNNTRQWDRIRFLHANFARLHCAVDNAPIIALNGYHS